MSLAAVLDAAAAKTAGIAGITAVYSAGAVDGELLIPDDLPSDVSAVTVFGGMPELSPGSWERVTWRIEIRIYVNRANMAASYRVLAALPERFVAAWRTDIDLGGTCSHSAIESMGEPEDEEVNGKPYLVLPIFILAKTASGQTYTA